VAIGTCFSAVGMGMTAMLMVLEDVVPGALWIINLSSLLDCNGWRARLFAFDWIVCFLKECRRKGWVIN
jgi:hypothetical protein